MKKRILGLDLGTTSIGWALVEESEKETSKIIKLGVRVNPLTTDEKTDFEKGRPLSTNADRTLKRSARRNLQRFKLRRANLIAILKKHTIITNDSILAETGKNTTHETLQIRAKAAKQQITLEELARVLLAINKKRGYKSSRKTKGEENEGVAIDGMAIAKTLYENNLTPGKYVYEQLKKGKKYVPDFYRSDLEKEFAKVWQYQQQFYPSVLDDELLNALKDQGQQNSRKRFLAIKGIYTAENKGKREEKKLQHYTWRSKAIEQQLAIEEVAYVLVEINNNLHKSSGYLGAISDRSKALYFNKITVGEYLWQQIIKNSHVSLKKQVFYRQDYLDEFEQIWETQAKYYSELTPELKGEIRDVVIFYQRKLKSQKGQISFCQFESREQRYVDTKTNKEKTRIVGRKVAAKSSPLFQEFKVWQYVNNVKCILKETEEAFVLKEEDKTLLFETLNIKGNLKESEVLKVLGLKAKDWKTNYPEGLEGNTTNKALYAVYEQIAINEGYGHDWNKKTAKQIKDELHVVFCELQIDTSILNFNATKEGEDFDKQPAYELWHLLHATEDDDTVSKEDAVLYGNASVTLKKKLVEKFGFSVLHAKLLATVTLPNDYGNLSTKAIRKIIPYLKTGSVFSDACKLAKYNHSNSETKEAKELKTLAKQLTLLPKNSLRNPVVEKILNQMINLVNQIITTYGTIDEVRIELARELKKSAKERELMTKGINEATRRNDSIKALLSKDFKIPNPTKNDVIRYRLWQELAANGYKDVFTNKKIAKEALFSKEIEIEHIIPKALVFDDSFSNKTLAFSAINKQKSNRTALDFITNDFNNELPLYKARVDGLYDKGKGAFSKAKRNKLLLAQQELSDGFIERDLRNSQYIAKKAKEILGNVVKDVVSTTGSITDTLRLDWGLVNMMKELNLPKYKALGLTVEEERLNVGTGKLKKVEVIKDWTKRNDHRHHAMDALTVAFTTRKHVQYFNFLNARKNEQHRFYAEIIGIEKKIKKGQKFIAPIPNFRSEAQKHIQNVLVSFKNKNKVVTKNSNIYKTSKGLQQKVQLTPRGQLHNETIYGKAKRLMSTPTKLGKNFTIAKANLIANKHQKELILAHLKQFNNNAVEAFNTKTLKKHPITFKNEPLKEVYCYEIIYTIRKPVSPDLKIEKVIDGKVKQILEERLKAYNGDKKKAFSNLETNPIWLHKEKGIAIKRVTITGVSNAVSLHNKKNHLGKEILLNEVSIPTSYVSTSNNHHIAIYKDDKGVLQESVVSFFEAVTRANQGLPIVDRGFNEQLGWEFLFSIKQNEMFLIPDTAILLENIDLLNDKNATLLSNYLFRVQKTSSKDYWFRHHLETTVTNNIDFTYRRITSPKNLKNIIKVRLNHLGNIVTVGEY
ncbi:type II CRISPR RNA-guided endonuclease Cas9 [Tenacibaculum sp. M341]|uniref:type II CRISPR RNA-guided endonuclease Cas9 n=1 Tax=Tenacibaculum sp. M341 TaxID=2530339 RepID=UPI0010529C76|nr:type II CRISPR RNA-guided endonuclease Cas9 [Tenacibaculum sp. M341]TCI94912.1 type II CRISPR RNA-guided endonuclease Cas9 [Tenacibaculum sp. M341]